MLSCGDRSGWLQPCCGAAGSFAVSGQPNHRESRTPAGHQLVAPRQSAAAHRSRHSVAALRGNHAERRTRGARRHRSDQVRRASTLSLALSPAANSRIGVALLKEFCERNPLTRLKVVVAPSREIVHGVGEGRWELGFGPFHHNMPAHFALHPCFSETRRLMIARDHPARSALARDAVGTISRVAAGHVVSRRFRAPRHG